MALQYGIKDGPEIKGIYGRSNYLQGPEKVQSYTQSN